MDKRYKRYMVFVWDKYDISGGLGTCVNSYDTLAEAKEAIAYYKDEYRVDYGMIFDRIEGVEIN